MKTTSTIHVSDIFVGETCRQNPRDADDSGLAVSPSEGKVADWLWETTGNGFPCQQGNCRFLSGGNLSGVSVGHRQFKFFSMLYLYNGWAVLRKLNKYILHTVKNKNEKDGCTAPLRTSCPLMLGVICTFAAAILNTCPTLPLGPIPRPC